MFDPVVQHSRMVQSEFKGGQGGRGAWVGCPTDCICVGARCFIHVHAQTSDASVGNSSGLASILAVHLRLERVRYT